MARRAKRDPTICRYRQLARDRQAADLKRLPKLGYAFDEPAGRRAVEFFQRFLRHAKGEWAGQPITLEDWQAEEILVPVFGWKNPDGTRRFRIVYIEIPRKGGKSTVGGGVGLFLLVADGEHGAEVYSAATKKDQAKIVHDAAKAMLKQSPELRRYAKSLRNVIFCEKLDARFEPLSADSDTLDGLNPHGVILDEMHAHKDRQVFDVLQTALGARRQPLTWIITTAGVYNPTSIGWEMHELATRVLEGAIKDDSFFAFISSADEGDDWRKPETWRKANPNIGVSVKESYVATECQRAQDSPRYENTFKRYFLNTWTEQLDRWIPIDRWNACDGTSFGLGDMAGKPCYAGLDLSSKLDMTALALLWPPDDDRDIWSGIWRFWVPADLVAERARHHRLPDYASWIREGWLAETDGNTIDYTAIANEITSINAICPITEIGFDPWNSSQFAVDLEADGFKLVEMRQGFRTLSEPSKTFEADILGRKLRHGGNPVMRWMVSNVTVREDPNGNIAPDKSSAAGKIDGVVATIMARGRASLSTGSTRSVYEERGPIVLG